MCFRFDGHVTVQQTATHDINVDLKERNRALPCVVVHTFDCVQNSMDVFRENHGMVGMRIIYMNRIICSE